MVGYEKNDVLTPRQKFIAGCISGMTTRFITQPLDVVKLRTQLQKKKVDRRWLQTTKLIMKEEGFTALWHGHNLGQVHSVLAVTSQFFVYEMSTKYIANFLVGERSKQILVFLCGVFAGCCSATLVLPLEVIRVRQMLVKDQYSGFFNGARRVYNSGGVLAFYEGLNATLLQMGPQVGISFAVFSFMQPLILRYLHTCDGTENCQRMPGNKQNPQNFLIATTIAGLLSGFVSKTATYPFELTKRRLQIGSHHTDSRFEVPSTSKNLIKCKRLAECMQKTYKKAGLIGFFQGWQITVCKSQLTSIVAFTTYEWMCFLLREWSQK